MTQKKVKAIIEIEDPELMLIDKVARTWLRQLEEKIRTINDRTKMHTIDIKSLKDKIK